MLGGVHLKEDALCRMLFCGPDMSTGEKQYAD
jgi:hypothetical protein